MTHLLEKNTPFIFSDDCIRAFQTLKDRLTEAPILIAPNWDLPLSLCAMQDYFAIGLTSTMRQKSEWHTTIPPLSTLAKKSEGRLLDGFSSSKNLTFKSY
ncbi:hypothetical protein Tco_1211078 [Tanacetum coccineum]